MKKLFLLYILFIFCITIKSQNPTWVWAKGEGGTANDVGNSIAVNNTAVFVAGSFASSSLTIGTTTLTNVNSNVDIYIAKYDVNGNAIWAKNFGGSGDDLAASIITDSTSIYMTGSFSSPTLSFGSTTLINSGTGNYNDIFIAKFDHFGNTIWAKSAQGSINDYSRSITCDSTGLYITGVFQSPTLTIGSNTLTNTNISGMGSTMFIAKYDKNGNELWAKRSIGSDTYGYSIVADTSGIYSCGYFISPYCVFGTDTLRSTGSNNQDLYVVKHNSAGNVIWARCAGGNSSDNAWSIAKDPTGVYVSGNFYSSSIIFGTYTLTNVSTNSNSDIFLAKYSSSGNPIWAKSFGDVGEDAGYSINSSGAGVYMTGYYTNNLALGSTTLTSNGLPEIFIAKYDASGTQIWSKSAGGSGLDYGLSVSANASDVYITGRFFSPTINVGSTVLNNHGGYLDMFVAKIQDITTDISESYKSENNEISIYPNPFTSKAIIIFKEEQTHSVIKIIDLLGKIIQTKDISGKQFILEKGELNNGIYFVQITDEKNQISNKKIIIQ